LDHHRGFGVDWLVNAQVEMMMGRTAVIGLGITGYSVVKYLYGREQLVVLDTRDAPPLLAQLKHDYPDVEVRVAVSRFEPDDFDRAIVSPGVALDSCVLEAARGRIPFDSDIDLFCDAAQAPIIAVTGTNGKSTVTDLTSHLLNSCGMKVPAGGNLGAAALDLLDDEADGYVLELSSFQLERLRRHHFAAAVILNVSEDHLDRHGDMATYLASKQGIYRDCAVAVANRQDLSTTPEFPVDQLVTFGADETENGHLGIVERDGKRLLARGSEAFSATESLPIAGRHNEQNALAACALALTQGVALEQLAQGLASFRGLPHRAERVLVADGVEYINDSKATNVGATVAALTGFGDATKPRLLLIAGGDGKGADFTPLRESVATYVKELIVFGKDAERLAATMDGVAAITRVSDMAAAVIHAQQQARAGDTVLLSPACASLDMYANFSARGEDFVQQVHEVAR
jgi:UDP-N-acetylmuramoylalanine--D-glutamate ligase